MFLKRDWLFSVQVSAGLRAGGTPVWAETKPSSVTALYFSAPLPRIPQGGFGGNGRKLKTGHRRTESSRLTAAGARTAFTDRKQYLNGSAIISLNSRIRPAQTALQETLGGKNSSPDCYHSAERLGCTRRLTCPLIQNRRPLGGKNDSQLFERIWKQPASVM